MKQEEKVLFKPLKKIMETTFLTVTSSQKISEVYQLLRKNSDLFEVMDYVYVINVNKEPIGVFSIKDIFRFQNNTPVNRFMQTKLVTVSENADPEVVAHTALKHGIKAVPVVEKNKIIGVVSTKNILQILNKSLRKDIFHFAGINHSHLNYENTMDVPVAKSVYHRLPWLIGGLMGILAVAAFISRFESTLQANLILAFFMPAIVYISGALCTQIEALLVRDLTVMGKQLKLLTYVLKQGTTSIIISLVISSLMFLTISSFWGNTYIALVIGVATFISLTITTLSSFAIILGIKKMGGDPALGGGPFGTVISDAMSIIIYFIVATIML